MKKTYLFAALLGLAATSFTTVSCGNDEPDAPVNPDNGKENAADIDYNSSNAKAWGNYMINTARLLSTDAQTLYTNWASNYKTQAPRMLSCSSRTMPQVVMPMLTTAFKRWLKRWPKLLMK